MPDRLPSLVVLGEILRGVLRRFLPGALVGTAGVTVLLSVIGRFVPHWSQAVIGIVGTSLLTTMGATLALCVMRRRLRPDADVSGRKSFVAGTLASSLALALLGAASDTVSLILAIPFIGGRLDILAMPAAQLTPVIVLPIVAGALVTTGLYLPWLARSDAKQTTGDAIR